MTKLKTSVWRTAENQKQTETGGFQLTYLSWDRNIDLKKKKAAANNITEVGDPNCIKINCWL